MSAARAGTPPLLELVEAAPPNLIFTAANALGPAVCRDIIERFEAAPDEQYPGRVGQRAGPDPSVKRSTDLVVSG